MPQATMTYEEVLAEHRELKRRLEDLSCYLERPRPDHAEEEAHEWAEGLAQRLLELHDKLSLHFIREEGSGFLKEVTEAYPRVSHATKGLAKEHLKMLRELRAILPEVMRFAEHKAPRGDGLRQRTKALLDFLSDHESRESELLEQLYYQDIGPGD